MTMTVTFLAPIVKLFKLALTSQQHSLFLIKLGGKELMNNFIEQLGAL